VKAAHAAQRDFSPVRPERVRYSMSPRRSPAAVTRIRALRIRAWRHWLGAMERPRRVRGGDPRADETVFQEVSSLHARKLDRAGDGTSGSAGDELYAYRFVAPDLQRRGSWKADRAVTRTADSDRPGVRRGNSAACGHTGIRALRSVPPAQGGPARTQAPGARSRIIAAQPDGLKFYVLVGEGDRFADCAHELTRPTENVMNAHFVAIGAVNDQMWQAFDETSRAFKRFSRAKSRWSVLSSRGHVLGNR